MLGNVFSRAYFIVFDKVLGTREKQKKKEKNCKNAGQRVIAGVLYGLRQGVPVSESGGCYNTKKGQKAIPKFNTKTTLKNQNGGSRTRTRPRLGSPQRRRLQRRRAGDLESNCLRKGGGQVAGRRVRARAPPAACACKSIAIVHEHKIIHTEH